MFIIVPSCLISKVTSNNQWVFAPMSGTCIHIIPRISHVSISLGAPLRGTRTGSYHSLTSQNNLIYDEIITLFRWDRLWTSHFWWIYRKHLMYCVLLLYILIWYGVVGWVQQSHWTGVDWKVKPFIPVPICGICCAIPRVFLSRCRESRDHPPGNEQFYRALPCFTNLSSLTVFDMFSLLFDKLMYYLIIKSWLA